jgi:DNA-binding NarL/FixJ family response regulator
MLAGQAGIQVVGESALPEGLDLKETEVLVMASVSVPPPAGIGNGSIGVVCLTDDPDAARAFLESGVHAWGVISPSSGADELGAAVRAVAEGLWVGAPGLVRDLVRFPHPRAIPDGGNPVVPLTQREREVLHLIAEGLANKQIALRLSISEHTVKFHLSAVYGKLNVSSRTEAVKRGLGLGLISL